MKFEDLLEEIDGFGRFQKLIVFLSFVGRFALPCHFLLNNYIGAIPPHHCDVTFLDDGSIFENLTKEQILTVTIPKQEDGSFSSCHMYSSPQFNLLDVASNFSDAPVIQCPNGWEFDKSIFSTTLASEWDLVCDRRGLNKAMATIFFVGVMAGAAIYGSLSDRYGRKPMLLVSYIFGLVFAMSSIFSTSIVMFAVLRFFTGLSITGLVIVCSVLNVEWVDIKSRKMVGVIDSTSWSFGYLVLPVIAYGVRDWKWLTVAITSPLIIAIISWRWVPESARWLIANGQFEKAHHYLKICAAMNRKKGVSKSIRPEVLSGIILEAGNRKYFYLDLFRTPKMRRLALLTGFTWFGVASTFYGISFNMKGFGLNLYLNQFLYGAVELPSKILVYYLLDRFGRRYLETGTLLLAGCNLMLNIFIPKDQWIVRSVIGVLGKGFASMSFSTLVLFSSELYPTVIRQNAMGYNSFLGRMGVAIAPLLFLLDDLWGHMSQMILCAIALLAGLVAYQLPETRGRCLLETIEDVEGNRMDKENAIKENAEEEQKIL